MTPDVLANATGCSLLTAARVLPLLDRCMAEFAINTPARRAGFLAQCAHESGLRARREDMSYRPEGLMRTWPRRFPTLASTNGLAWNPERLANTVYANRMGNGDALSGDGFKYRGGGYLQATGRAMYAALQAALGVPLLDQPDRILADDVAARSAAWIWAVDKRCNELMDGAQFDATSKAINLGDAEAEGEPVGADARRALFRRLVRLT